MKTIDKPEIQQALQDGESEIGNARTHDMAMLFFLKALTLAVCAVADGISDLVAVLPEEN